MLKSKVQPASQKLLLTKENFETRRQLEITVAQMSPVTPHQWYSVCACQSLWSAQYKPRFHRCYLFPARVSHPCAVVIHSPGLPNSGAASENLSLAGSDLYEQLSVYAPR